MKKLILRISIAVLIIFPLLCMGCVLFYLSGNSSNHTGVEFLLVLIPLATAFLVTAGLLIKHRGKSIWAALALNVIAVLFFIAIDHLNIMVQYDRWLERGMPVKFEILR